MAFLVIVSCEFIVYSLECTFFVDEHCVFFVKMISFYFWLHSVLVAAGGLSLVAVSRGCSLVAAQGLLTAVASLVAEHRLQGTWASVVVAYGL